MNRKNGLELIGQTDIEQLKKWEKAQGTPQQVALRSRIGLGIAAGRTDVALAARLKVNRHTIRLWCQRICHDGIGCVWEIASGRGRKPQYKVRRVDKLIRMTLRQRPKGQTHWSCRSMAAKEKISKSTVHRIWQLHNIKPHLTRTFKLSRDPQFIEKLTDVVGLYLNPPQKAIVLCVDEKTQIQAIERTQPGLPLRTGRNATHSHDYKRNGTTTLFASLDMMDGKVIGQFYARHRHQEWIKFLTVLDRSYPSDMSLHVIMDNYGTHKSPAVKAWLKRHPRFFCHFIPTSSSWLNMVERWFKELTDKAIRRGSFANVPVLQKAIEDYLSSWNDDPRPFVWTATVGEIVEKLGRARKKLEEIEPGCTLPRRRKTKKVLNV